MKGYDSMNVSLKRTAYIVTFFALVSLFALLYYAGYYYATSTRMGSDHLLTKKEVADMNPAIRDISSTADAAVEEEPVVTSDTAYIEESFDMDTGELTQANKEIPIALLGLTRTQVIDYLTTFTEEETDYMLTNIQLVAFSREQLVIRKTVRSIKEIYKYFVICEEDIIKIYLADRQTLFADTGIDIRNISEDHKRELKDGFYIETVHELYNYLESVTS